MFYLFTSNFSTRYKRDALEVLCYPRGHVVRFRYDEKHVAPLIKKFAAGNDGSVTIPNSHDTTAMLIFAEANPTQPEAEFEFFPLRQARIIQIHKVGTAYYLDLALAGYIPYGADVVVSLNSYRGEISKLPYYPLPQITNSKGWGWYAGQKKPYEKSAGSSQGYFLNYVPENTGGRVSYTVDSPDEHQAWQSVVDALSKSPDLANSLFYRLVGPMKIVRRLLTPWRFSERIIPPTRRGIDVEYYLPMGRHSMIKVLTYRSRLVADPGERVLHIESKGDGFAGISPEKISIDSRYNEQRVVLACKRVLDNTVSPIFIRPDDNVFGPKVFILTKVEVPRFALLMIFVFFLLGAFLLSLSPDSVEKFGKYWEPLKLWNTEFAMASKVLGAIVTAWAAFFGFRKLPLRG